MDIRYSYFLYIDDRPIKIASLSANLCVSHSTFLNNTASTDIAFGGGVILMTTGNTFVFFESYIGMCNSMAKGLAIRVIFNGQKYIYGSNFDRIGYNETSRYVFNVDYGKLIYQYNNMSYCNAVHCDLHAFRVSLFTISYSNYIGNNCTSYRSFIIERSTGVMKNCSILNETVSDEGYSLIETSDNGTLFVVSCIFQNITASCIFKVTSGSIGVYNSNFEENDTCNHAIILDSEPDYTFQNINYQPIYFYTCFVKYQIHISYQALFVFIFM